MASLAVRNNNPGNLRDPKTGAFRQFNTPEEGYAALLNDLEAKRTGHTSTGLSGNSSINDFAHVYAPPTENNSTQYGHNLATQLHTDPNASIASVDIGQLAQSVAHNEDSSAPGPGSAPPSFISDTQMAQMQQQPQSQGGSPPSFISDSQMSQIHSGFVDPNQPLDSSGQGYGYVTPPPLTQNVPDGSLNAPQLEKKGLVASLLGGAGNILKSAEAPFIGAAAIPVQALAKAMGRPDPFAGGIPAGIPGTGQKTDVTPLALEQKAGDIAQVGSYFIPGSTGLKAVAGAAGTGILQGAGAAMSAGKNLPDVATQGAIGGAIGGGLAGGAQLIGAGLRAAGDTMSGEAAKRALNGIKEAYSSALNLNAAERGFEMRGGKDIAQVLMEHQAPLGRYENGTLDASRAIPKLQEALDPLNAAADTIVGNSSLNTEAKNFISLDSAEQSLLERIKQSGMDSLEKEHAISHAQELFAATKREYGDVVSPQVGEKIKQGLQSTAFKKALTTPDALQKNVSYLASNVMKNNVEQAIGGEAGKQYRAINLQRADLVDAITRLSKLDGVRLVRGGRLGNMAGGMVGAISGAASGLGTLGALAGDYFGTKAAEFLNNPATKIAAAEAKAKAAGIIPGLLGGAGKIAGKGIGATGNAIGKMARPIGLVGNLMTK